MSLDYPSFYSYKKRKARKTHICCECMGTIHISEYYNHYFLVFDNDPFNYSICTDCDDLRTKIDEGFTYEESCPFTELGYYINETNDKSFAQEFLNIMKKRNSLAKTDYLEQIIKNN